jgi:hypothetical protein
MNLPSPIFIIPTEPPRTPLPTGSVLALPSGDIGVMDDGKLFSTNHRWVVGVALAANLVLVVRDRTEKYVPTRLLHELMGYLTACGCELILLDFRCPLAWRHGGSFESVRGLWVARFFEESDRMLFAVPLPLSEKPMLVLPLASIAADATLFLLEAASVMTAAFSDPDSADQLLRPLLARKVSEWERRWNEALALASPADIAADEWGWLPKVDLALADLVRTHLEPWGYRLQAATLARLL